MLTPSFSVLMSVYYKDDANNLALALKSVLEQTLQPSEILLVRDGPLTPDLDSKIESFLNRYSDILKVVELSENRGLGEALRAGLEHCTYDMVARMDSDDISYPYRFEKQIAYMLENPNISVLGNSIQEFDKTPEDLNQFKTPPLYFDELETYAKYRNPLNHPSVVFRKSHVLDAGSYQDMPLFEDYYLWVRMINKGYKLANLKEPLLHFRIGDDMIGRRHGMSYLKKEFTFLRTIKRIGFINNKQFYLSLITKLPLRLLPKFLLKLLYKLFLR